MRFKLFILVLFAVQFSFAQSPADSLVNNSNYYSHLDKKAPGMNWLRSADVIPIIIDELLKNGIEHHTIRFGELIKLNDSTRLVGTIVFEKGRKIYSFLYEATHSIPISVKDRDFLSDPRKVSYMQLEKNPKGLTKFMKINSLPENVFLLRQTCYWFQFDTNGTKYAVSKEVISNILRQDVNDYLRKL